MNFFLSPTCTRLLSFSLLSPFLPNEALVLLGKVNLFPVCDPPKGDPHAFELGRPVLCTLVPEPSLGEPALYDHVFSSVIIYFFVGNEGVSKNFETFLDGMSTSLPFLCNADWLPRRRGSTPAASHPSSYTTFVQYFHHFSTHVTDRLVRCLYFLPLSFPP